MLSNIAVLLDLCKMRFAHDYWWRVRKPPALPPGYAGVVLDRSRI
jgi:hypothetical protein